MRNFIPHFIQEQYNKECYEGHFDAVTLSVDLSRFTPMTQTLMQAGKEGAEVLTVILNELFEAMVNAVYERGGFITGFAGDGFTAVFPLHRGSISADTLALHGLACAERIQAIFRRHGVQTTPCGQFTLRAKIGISYGAVHWGIVGQEQKTYFFHGPGIEGCAVAQQHAGDDDIICDQQVATLMQRDTVGAEQVARGCWRFHTLPTALLHALPAPHVAQHPTLDPSVVSQFIPEPVMKFNETGEFRHVAVIFFSFQGISTRHEFDALASVLLKHISTFSGYVNHFDFGDKGGIVFCGFGAPVAYEKIIDRALGCLLAVKHDLHDVKPLSDLRLRAGISYGMAYTGIAGGEKQCEYTYYGDVVNLAARLAMNAHWGEIRVSETVSQKTTAKFNFGYKGLVQYKGFADPIPTYVLTSQKNGTAGQGFRNQMIGRQAELRQLQEFVVPIFNCKFAGIAYIYGEAGIGKSRLAYALQKDLTHHHELYWFNCPVDQIVQKPFNPFTNFLMHYFEQSSEKTEEENRATFEEKYQALIEKVFNSPLERGMGNDILKELIRTQSIIGAQLGLFWKDALWEQLDAKGKYENTLYAIKNFFLAHSLVKPVVIEIRDGHWVDNDSLALLDFLTRHVSDYPLVVLSSLRYNDDGTTTKFTTQHGIKTLEIPLISLSAVETKRCAEAELEGSISEALHHVFLEKTQGNPFFIQQIARYLVEHEAVRRKATGWQLCSDTPTLPETINAVLIARIDRLADQVKEVVKVAAVIGRKFDVILLSAVLRKDILSQVRIIEQGKIWQHLQELQYIFKHALLRDAAYEMQLRARLRDLHHLTAEMIEKLYTSRLAEKYAELAFHYEHADVKDKAIEYLQKAGDDAKAKYHNHQALKFYDRLLSHLKDDQHFIAVEIDTLLKKGEIFHLIGDVKECQQVLEDALRLSEQSNDKNRMGQTQLVLGSVFRDTGDYKSAMTYFERALALFTSVNERARVGHALKEMGVVYDYKGAYDVAITYYEKALNISQDVGDTLGSARIANNIGIVYDLKGEYKTAMKWYQKSLHISKKLNAKLRLSRVVANIGENHRLQGNYEAAMACYEQALTMKEELGDKRQIAIVADNMGLIYKAQGKYKAAMACYDRAIAIGRELQNTFNLCAYLIDKAEILLRVGHYPEAESFNTEGVQIAEAVGRKEYILQGNVLATKVEYALGKPKAATRLYTLLQQTHNNADIATLHYELWKMTHNDSHRQMALMFYQPLYRTTPNIEYKARIEEMIQ